MSRQFKLAASFALVLAVGFGSTAITPPASAAPGPWSPAPGTTWQWQLTGTINTSLNVEVYDIDMDVNTSIVTTLRNAGKKTICYMSAGSSENWRSDDSSIPSSVKGNSNGWPGERWLDIRQRDILGPIMAARMDRCKAKGFDAVEADNVDGYSNNTGFPLTAAHQLAYNKMLADLAHARGLSIGLKNDVEQVRDLVNYFDFAINEECAQWNECQMLKPFIDAGKAVFHVEYGSSNSFCATTEALGFSSMRKRTSLDAWREPCTSGVERPTPRPPTPPPSTPTVWKGVSGSDAPGLVDPATGVWWITDWQGDSKSFYFGNPGDVPFMGDWNCDGIDTPGLYRRSDGYVYLRNSNTQGVADISYYFGNPGDIPLAGDFDGDGCDTVALYRPSTGRFYVINSLGSKDQGLGKATTDYLFGNPGDVPFAGDFNGDGIDTFGLYRTSTGLVYMRNSHKQGVADLQFIYGNPNDRFVTGDWDNDNRDSPGVLRPSNRTLYVRYQNSAGAADYAMSVKASTLIPVSGYFGNLP